MNNKFSLFCLGIALLVLFMLPYQTGLTQAEQPIDVSTEQSNEVAAVITPVMGYQGRLVEGGVPVTGNRSMTFSLYTAAPTGGSKVWGEGPEVITVNNGLFYTVLGDTIPFDTATINSMDQNLWLEVQVDSSTLPRQPLLGSPYAFSLAAGADIEGSLGTGQSVLNATNIGGGLGLLGQATSGYGVFGRSDGSHGVYAESGGAGLVGSALMAQSFNSGGIALWALSTSTDTTLVSSNNGAGPLFKGFGGNGGEHEFIILNDGTVQQDRAASGLAKAGVKVNCSNAGSYIIIAFNNVGGTISIANGATQGTCEIDFGFEVDDRIIMAMGTGASSALGVTCLPVAGSPNDIKCMRWGADGLGLNGQIYVTIY